MSLSDWESVHSRDIVKETGDSVFGILMRPEDIMACQCDWSSVLKQGIVDKYAAASKSNKKSIARHAKELADKQGALMMAVC